MIKSEKEYQVIVQRMEELLAVSENIENPATKGYLELNLLADMVADYEENHHPVQPPTLSESLKLRMYERGLSQKALAEFFGSKYFQDQRIPQQEK